MIKKGYINLFGHIHNHDITDEYDSKLYSKDKHINICVDKTDFKPVSIDYINEVSSSKNLF